MENLNDKEWYAIVEGLDDLVDEQQFKIEVLQSKIRDNNKYIKVCHMMMRHYNEELKNSVILLACLSSSICVYLLFG
jgi:hypothetical protein